MRIQRNADLKPFNTFGVSVRAAALAEFSSIAELRALLALDELNGSPRLVLGGGSNVLFTRDWPGVVLRNVIQGIEVLEETDTHVRVRSGAGVVWHEFVLHCVAKGWGGIENLSLIPGKVGAAPMQNIGAYGVEIKDTFDHLEALNVETGEVVRFDRAACAFGYRESFFKREGKDRFIILSVAFKLNKQPVLNTSYGNIKHELEKRNITAPTLRDVSDAVIHIRRSKLPDPAVIGNAGSFFKNPVVPAAEADRLKAIIPDLVTFPAPSGKMKLAAGQLIEKAGWKGYRADDHGVHKDQALVLVNYGRATGAEVWDLSGRIVESIREKYGVELEREVNII
jgi:UDP-N-acetylmuramate dehydrogenase